MTPKAALAAASSANMYSPYLFTGLQYAIILLSPSSEGIIGCFVRRSAKYRHLSIFRNLCVWFIILVSSIITRRNSIIVMAIA
jgi:hypothetical protein